MTEDMFLSQYQVGDRVEAHPACDCWMAGDRFGTVTMIGRFYVHVMMDVSGKVRKFVPEKLMGKVKK